MASFSRSMSSLLFSYQNSQDSKDSGLFLPAVGVLGLSAVIAGGGAGGGVGRGEGHDGGVHQGRQRRVGAGDEHPRRAEQGVDDERGHGGVEAGDGGQPGELGVGHALGDQQRGEHDPGPEVAPDVGAPVVTRRVDAREPTAQAPGHGQSGRDPAWRAAAP